MPILVQKINDRILSTLDAEGSERYTFDQDIKFSINASMEILITWFNRAFGDKKLSPEQLRELVKVKVWQANQYSRVAFNATDVGHDFWTLFGVYPKMKANRNLTGSPLKNKSESKFRDDISFISSEKSAKRLTLEEWNQNSKNAFMPGNTILNGALADYAYLDFADFTSKSYDAGGKDKVEITVRPDIPGELVGLAYLKYPTQVNAIGDSIEFPESLTELFVEIACNKISWKQGDGTNLWGVSDKNISRLVSLMS